MAKWAARCVRLIRAVKPSIANGWSKSWSCTVGCRPKLRKNGDTPVITSAAVTVSVSVLSPGLRRAATSAMTLMVMKGSLSITDPSILASTLSSSARSASMAEEVEASTGISVLLK